jgi:Na+-transporting NADH:ubiquinone oxidoreductase subunit NqrB
VIPRRGDPRWPVLALLLAYVVFALSSPGFSRRPAQFLASVLTCVVLDLALGRAKGILLVPLSGLITALGTLLLCDSPTVWAYALVAALSVLSKQLIRLDGRHVFNPNNFGIVVALLFFSGDVTVVAGRWGGSGALMGLIALLGVYAARRAGRLSLAAAYVGSFFLGVLARKALYGAPLSAVAAPMTGAAFQLFTFFMVTDPKTTPQTRAGQCAFGVALGLVDNVFRFLQVNSSPFYALFLLTALQPLASLARLLAPGRGFSWISAGGAPAPAPCADPKKRLK